MPRAREPEQLFRIPNPESPTPALKNEDTDMAHFELVEKMAPNANIKVIGVGGGGGNAVRSEEHTSELQSLMRISYAVFCLKKIKPNHTTHTKCKNYNQKLKTHKQ